MCLVILIVQNHQVSHCDSCQINSHSILIDPTTHKALHSSFQALQAGHIGIFSDQVYRCSCGDPDPQEHQQQEQQQQHHRFQQRYLATPKDSLLTVHYKVVKLVLKFSNHSKFLILVENSLRNQISKFTLVHLP